MGGTWSKTVHTTHNRSCFSTSTLKYKIGWHPTIVTRRLVWREKTSRSNCT